MEGQINIHVFTKRIMTKPVHTPTQCVKRLPQNSGSLQTTVMKLCCKFTTHQNMLHAYYACGILKQDPHFDIFVNYNWVVTRWQYTFTHKQYMEQHKTNNT